MIRNVQMAGVADNVAVRLLVAATVQGVIVTQHVRHDPDLVRRERLRRSSKFRDFHVYARGSPVRG
jgi:hypothetical protein